MKRIMKGTVYMELDERKLKILNAVIKSYLNTGEPVVPSLRRHH